MDFEILWQGSYVGMYFSFEHSLVSISLSSIPEWATCPDFLVANTSTFDRNFAHMRNPSTLKKVCWGKNWKIFIENFLRSAKTLFFTHREVRFLYIFYKFDPNHLFHKLLQLLYDGIMLFSRLIYVWLKTRPLWFSEQAKNVKNWNFRSSTLVGQSGKKMFFIMI